MIHCAFASSESYWQHLGVAITSMLAASPSRSFDVHIVHDGVGAENLAKMEGAVAIPGRVQVSFHKFDSAPYRHFRLHEHLTLVTYFRLFLGEILPAEIDRVLFIDADVVVLDDVGPLWDTDLEGKLVAAAPDPFGSENERLGLPPDYTYFNSGVLLIDLGGWRATGIFPDFMHYIEVNHERAHYLDQDALNGVLFERVKYLDYRWNFQARTGAEHVAKLGYDRQGFAALRKRPGIVHFTSSRKPWNYRPDVAFERAYLEQVEKSPWAGFRQPDRTLGLVLRRYFIRGVRGLPWASQAWRLYQKRFG